MGRAAKRDRHRKKKGGGQWHGDGRTKKRKGGSTTRFRTYKGKNRKSRTFSKKEKATKRRVLRLKKMESTDAIKNFFPHYTAGKAQVGRQPKSFPPIVFPKRRRFPTHAQSHRHQKVHLTNLNSFPPRFLSIFSPLPSLTSLSCKKEKERILSRSLLFRTEIDAFPSIFFRISALLFCGRMIWVGESD